ncbi:ATP-binding protein [Clostridium sp. C2-6-12]|uniref:ATP-binding protein n=1 Tax=Clostridium sp. C2-6-12 TaxID=2698832 RepID=UPI001368B148|nr:ATP-binding protein [Clostridium sp. C2-6-12]
MNYIDIIISLMQSVLFLYMIKYLADDEIVNSKKIILYLTLFSTLTIIIPGISQSILMSSSLTHILTLVLTICIFTKEKYKNIIVSYSLIYSIVAIWLFIFGNLLYGILEQIISNYSMKKNIYLIMYCSQLILFSLCYIFRSKIKKIYKLLSHESISINYAILLGFLPDFLLFFYFISYEIDNSIFKEIIIIAFSSFIVFNIYSFIRIVKKANKIKKLNRSLIIKNKELKNIKYDYSLQMNCLFELANMDKYDNVTDLLKSIINKQNNPQIIYTGINSTSILSLALQHIKSDNINIVLDDKADYKMTTISEMELYRILINIVNNAIKAMKNKGTLVAKSFEDLKNITITIENDGEKIPEENISKIFNPGFTTKNNTDKNHGYGLSIVKDLIKSHNGNIFVESDEFITRFTIILPKNFI